MSLIKRALLKLMSKIASRDVGFANSLEKVAASAQGFNPVDSFFLRTIHRDLLEKSKSQLRQDLFVLSTLNEKKNGFFVEFGATNGLDLSNTFLLEKEFGWTGILAEPAKLWHTELGQNRNSIIDTRCVWKKSGELLTFKETNLPELSTIDLHAAADTHARARSKGIKYEVTTVSLVDLLDEHNAPREIDYLSIDTEGSEYEILENFDFSRYRFKVITCEHNFTENRGKLLELFERNGYSRKYEDLSQFDDWYVST